MIGITFGTDPEFMLVQDGQYYSAIGIVQGDRENRINIKGHQFFYDNVMAECAIKPGKNRTQVLRNFGECFQIYAQMVDPFRLHIQASQNYPESQLQHPEARHVGCSPDSCAYEMDLKDPPKDIIENTPFRSCGGHIHLGNPVLTSDGHEPWLAVYLLDLFLAVPSLWIDQDPTAGPRRTLYGQAGRYRTKDYGIEYRSLGNFWLRTPKLVGWVYDVCAFVIETIVSGEADKIWSFDPEIYFESDTKSDAWTCHLYDPKKLRAGIDSNDRTLVAEHFDLAKRLLPSRLTADMEALVAEQCDFYEAWRLDAR